MGSESSHVSRLGPAEKALLVVSLARALYLISRLGLARINLRNYYHIKRVTRAASPPKGQPRPNTIQQGKRLFHSHTGAPNFPILASKHPDIVLLK